MKTRTTWVLVIFLSLAALEADAQNFKKLVGKALKGEKVSIKAKDSTTVVVIDDPSSSDNARFSDEVVMKAFGLSDQVDFENNYDYDAFISFEVTHYDTKGEPDESMFYETYVRRKQADYAMVFKEEDVASTYIYDADNSAMLVLTDTEGEKSGFATNFKPESWQAEATEGSLADVSMMKTGNTKEILGYTCEEYLTEDEESEVHIWVSEEAGKTIKSPMLQNQQMGITFAYGGNLEGMILEYEAISKKNKERTIMQVQDLDLYHTHSISTKEYPVIAIKKE